MISISLQGNLGNHMWQYAVGRTVAEYKGFQYHVPADFKGKDIFLNCDLGTENPDIKYVFPELLHFDQIQKYDPNIWNIKDFTVLHGFFQTEKYILNNKSNVMQWFSLKDQCSSLKKNLCLDKDVCVINFRGGDYKQIKDVYLPPKYFYDATQHMLDLNKNMKFIVITDDVETAETYFNLPIYHYSVAQDFAVVNAAKYLIISNSTFSWWAAWLSPVCRMVIAPKYWLRHNTSTGWWSPSDSITTGFSYVDTNGNLFTSNECLLEITDDNYTNHYG